MERRLQLLLDAERYARVAAEASRSGRSVAAVIREAIDWRLPADLDVRAEAVDAFLALTANPEGAPADDWATMKREDEAALDEEIIG